MRNDGDGHGYGQPESQATTGSKGRPTDTLSGTRPRLMSIAKACHYLGGVSVEIIRTMRKRGELSEVRFGRRVFLRLGCGADRGRAGKVVEG